MPKKPSRPRGASGLPAGCQALLAPPGTICPRCRKPFPGAVAYDPDPRRRSTHVALCGECLKEASR